MIIWKAPTCCRPPFGLGRGANLLSELQVWFSSQSCCVTPLRPPLPKLEVTVLAQHLLLPLLEPHAGEEEQEEHVGVAVELHQPRQLLAQSE